MPPRAWVRSIPASYRDATCGVLTTDPLPIDIELARRQHGAVVEGLAWLGFEVAWIPPEEALPDSVFVEDPAVLSQGRALIAASAHPVRSGEADSVRRALSEAGFAIRVMDRGTLDGGDVLEVGNRMYVSPSSRTDAEGIEALAQAFADREIRVLPLPDGVLHLKCACSTPAPGTVVVAAGTFDPEAFDGLRVLEVPHSELYAANTIGRAGRVLVAAGHPETARVLGAAGLEVRALDLSEIRKGDGSLTCLSLRAEAHSNRG